MLITNTNTMKIYVKHLIAFVKAVILLTFTVLCTCSTTTISKSHSSSINVLPFIAFCTNYNSEQHEALLYKEYLDKLGWLESRNTWHATNNHGAVGRWQLLPICHKDLQLHKDLKWSMHEILQDSVKQIKTQLLLIERQKQLLRSYDCYSAIGKQATYNNKQFIITEASLLAACHLGGAKSVKHWIDSDFSSAFKDGNGVSIAKYAYDFSTVHLNKQI